MNVATNVCIIPAKGISRRIPRKNVCLFLGRPIILYSIQTAVLAGIFDEVWVSTDDLDIAEYAKSMDVQAIMRPPELCEVGVPDCGTQEVTRHAIEFLQASGKNVEMACCLYATAPLVNCRDLMQGRNALMRVPSPPFSYSVGPDGKDAGAFYFGHARAFIDRVDLYEYAAKVYLPAERTCDINTPEDWHRAEELYVELHEAMLAQHRIDGLL